MALPDEPSDELLGLDPFDPETQEFVRHRERMEHPNAEATVEGMVAGLDDFADSANRAVGHRRVVAVAMVLLILLGLMFTVWTMVVFVIATLFH